MTQSIRMANIVFCAWQKSLLTEAPGAAEALTFPFSTFLTVKVHKGLGGKALKKLQMVKWSGLTKVLEIRFNRMRWEVGIEKSF